MDAYTFTKALCTRLEMLDTARMSNQEIRQFITNFLREQDLEENRCAWKREPVAKSGQAMTAQEFAIQKINAKICEACWGIASAHHTCGRGLGPRVHRRITHPMNANEEYI